jgi:phage/conjugal plasmid C-4 type zinc finger TraR family protein
MDDIDLANEHAEMHRQHALRAHFSTRPVREDGQDQKLFGPRLCIDCGEEIETARLHALPYAVRCVDCQAKKERRQ